MRTSRCLSLLLFAAPLVVPIGCGSAALRSTPVRLGDAIHVGEGLTYSLPRTFIKADITYQSVETNNATTEARVKEVTIASETVPDARLTFRIDPKSLERFHIAVKDATITVTPDGVLTAIDIPFEDRSAEIAKGVLKTAIGVVKVLAVSALVKEEVVDKEITVSRLLDVTDFTEIEQDGDWRVWEYVEGDRTENLLESGMKLPNVKLRLRARHDLMASATATADRVANGTQKTADRDGPGVFVRVPAAALLDVYVDDVPQQSSVITIAQGGGIAWLPVRSRRWASTSTKLSVSPATGAITNFAYSTTSPGEAVTALAAELSEQLAATRKELLDIQIDIAKKELELLEAQRELEKAQRDNEDSSEE